MLGGLIVAGLAVVIPTPEAPIREQPRSLEPLFQQAYAEMGTLGLAGVLRSEESLREVIDAKNQPPAQKSRARLIASELVLRRALACQIAVAFDAAALDGEASIYSKKDLDLALAWFARVPPTPPKFDPVARERVKALSLIVNGASDAVVIEVLPPAGAEEIVALAMASRIWRDKTAIPDAGLIPALQMVKNPTTLLRSVIAMLLWRSDRSEEARSLLDEILAEVPDQPTAVALSAAMKHAKATDTSPERPQVPSGPIEPGKAPPAPSSRREPRTHQTQQTSPPDASAGGDAVVETPRVTETPKTDSLDDLMPVKRKETQSTHSAPATPATGEG